MSHLNNAYYVKRILIDSYQENKQTGNCGVVFFFFNLFFYFFSCCFLGRNEVQTGTTKREREQNKDITKSCGATAESGNGKKRDISFSGKHEFSAWVA